MLTEVTFLHGLREMSSMMLGHYEAKWNGKWIWFSVNLSPKDDNFIEIYCRDREPIGVIKSSELKAQGKSHVPHTELISEYLTEKGELLQ